MGILSKEKEQELKKLEQIELTKDTVDWLRRRRHFQRAEALKEVLNDTYNLAKAINNTISLNEPYSSNDYIIETIQDGETENFIIKRR